MKAFRQTIWISTREQGSDGRVQMAGFRWQGSERKPCRHIAVCDSLKTENRTLKTLLTDPATMA